MYFVCIGVCSLLRDVRHGGPVRHALLLRHQLGQDARAVGLEQADQVVQLEQLGRLDHLADAPDGLLLQQNSCVDPRDDHSQRLPVDRVQLEPALVHLGAEEVLEVWTAGGEDDLVAAEGAAVRGLQGEVHEQVVRDHKVPHVSHKLLGERPLRGYGVLHETQGQHAESEPQLVIRGGLRQHAPRVGWVVVRLQW